MNVKLISNFLLQIRIWSHCREVSCFVLKLLKLYNLILLLADYHFQNHTWNMSQFCLCEIISFRINYQALANFVTIKLFNIKFLICTDINDTYWSTARYKKKMKKNDKIITHVGPREWNMDPYLWMYIKGTLFHNYLALDHHKYLFLHPCLQFLWLKYFIYSSSIFISYTLSMELSPEKWNSEQVVKDSFEIFIYICYSA